MLKVGDKAPQFSLLSDTGEQLSLKDLAGRRVVLFFFPKASTPG
jgi:peroxiredoxin Q/BCP